MRLMLFNVDWKDERYQMLATIKEPEYDDPMEIPLIEFTECVPSNRRNSLMRNKQFLNQCYNQIENLYYQIKGDLQ